MGYGCRGELPADEEGTVSLDELSADDLVAGIVNTARERLSYQFVIGRLAAELHRRDPRTWTFYRLAAETHLPRSSLHRWARPFLDAAGEQ